MDLRGYLRCAAALLTGLWVTVGAAIPIGYLLLRALRAVNGGALGPELLDRPAVVIGLVAAYAVAASIGGWAATWITLQNPRRLTIMLSVSHVGSWLFVLALGASPFTAGISLSLAAAAVFGTIAGVTARARRFRGATGEYAPGEGAP